MLGCLIWEYNRGYVTRANKKRCIWHAIRIIDGVDQQRGSIMTKAQLLKKIALLESVNDQLSTEVSYVDHLMRLLGFSEGLVTVKATAQEIIDKGLNIDIDDSESEPTA